MSISAVIERRDDNAQSDQGDISLTWLNPLSIVDVIL